MRQPVTRAAADYLPGDIVAWDLGGGILHIGIVSDRRAADRRAARSSITSAPGAREEDILFRYTIIGHYRLQGPGAGLMASSGTPVAAH